MTTAPTALAPTSAPAATAATAPAPATAPPPTPAIAGPSPTLAALSPSDVEHIVQLSASYTAELQSKMARLDGVIGEVHWPSVGAFKESILRRHLADKVPRKFEVGTGFIIALDRGKKSLSKQLDIIIWNSHDHGPLFRDGDFVILPPEAVAAVISVKKYLDAAALREALQNVDSVTQFLEFRPHTARLFTAIFAFDIDPTLTFPVSIFNALNAHYVTCSAHPIAQRLSWSQQFGREWQSAWIDDIVVLPKGVISLFEATINKTQSAGGHKASGYAAYQTSATINDTYGFLECDLMAHLLTPGPISALHQLGHAGAASILFANKPRLLWPDKSYTLIPFPSVAVTSVGILNQKALADFNKRLHRPRKPRTTKKTAATKRARKAAAVKKTKKTPATKQTT